jgi:hypothetical protein
MDTGWKGLSVVISMIICASTIDSEVSVVFRYSSYTVKKVSDFPVHSRDVTNQTLLA